MQNTTKTTTSNNRVRRMEPISDSHFSSPLFKKFVIVAVEINTFDNYGKMTIGSEEEMPKQEIVGISEANGIDMESRCWA